MTHPRRKFTEPPRMMTEGELASYIGHSAGWLSPDRRRALEKQGFPPKDNLLDRTDRRAVDAFLDRRSGLTSGDYDDGLGQRLEEMALGTPQD